MMLDYIERNKKKYVALQGQLSRNGPLYLLTGHRLLKKILYFFSLKIEFILANSIDSDKILHHLGLQCIPKYLRNPFSIPYSRILGSQCIPNRPLEIDFPSRTQGLMHTDIHSSHGPQDYGTTYFLT